MKKVAFSQPIWWIVILMPLFVVYLLADYFMYTGNQSINLVQLLFNVILFIGVFINFYKIEVTVDDASVEIAYGVGFVKSIIFLDTVDTVRVVRNSNLMNVNLRTIRHGVIYNLFCRNAVEMIIKNNRRIVRIGIGNAQMLCDVITSEISKRRK